MNIIGEFEKAVLEREDVRRESKSIYATYMAYFGDLLKELYTLKVECVKYKKQIAFCQAKENEMKITSGYELECFIENEMEPYIEKLNLMLDSSSVEKVDSQEVEECKKIYYKIAKWIHPDLNPKCMQFSEIRTLWEGARTAYYYFNLKELQEYEIALASLLDKYEIKEIETIDGDVEEKLKEVVEEINKIKNTKPYIYKELLEDPSAMANRAEELGSEIEQYKEYLDELKDEFSKYAVLWVNQNEDNQ